MKNIPIFNIFIKKPEPQQNSHSAAPSVSGQTPAEEIVNSLTHGLGLVLSIGGLSVLIVFASIYGTAWHIISSAIYGSSLVLLYAVSTLYHAVRSAERKQRLRTMEQGFIFLLIAGTYTPFTIVAMNASWGWSLFGVVWGFALAGIVLNTLYTHHFPIISNLLFLGIGWLSVIAIIPLKDSLPLGGLLWLLLGGLSYTFGIIFLSWCKIPFSHSVWHVSVIVGSFCHYVAVLFYVIPL
jgi:hemolysin III